jgi:RNA polymerase sigma-70 factor (sigma-E family)
MLELLETGDRVRADDDFDEFVDAHAQSLFRLAYVLTGDLGDAEDVLQDVLAQALSRWSDVRAAASPEAYLRRMLVNANVSRWRRFRRRETPVAVVVPVTTAPDSADEALDAVERQELWQAVLALPRTQRTAIALRFHESLSYAEIAEATGCREATARSHVHRGLAALRETIGDQVGGEAR